MLKALGGVSTAWLWEPREESQPSRGRGGSREDMASAWRATGWLEFSGGRTQGFHPEGADVNIQEEIVSMNPSKNWKKNAAWLVHPFEEAEAGHNKQRGRRGGLGAESRQALQGKLKIWNFP